MLKKRFLVTASVLLLSLLLPAAADATMLTQTSVSLGRLGINASVGNDALVTFKLKTTPTSVAKIKVVFPVGFTIANGTPAITTTGFPNTPASIAPAPGSLTAVSDATTRSITVSGLTSGSLDNTTLFGFKIASGVITNPAVATQYNPTVESEDAGGATIDYTIAPVYIYGASANQDQVVVNGSVAPNFSFSLSAASDIIPTVDASTIKTSFGVTMNVGTNSPLGYTAYVKSASGALTSAINSGTPILTGTFNAAPDTVTAGTTKYGLVPSTGTACTLCTGTLNYDPEFAVADGTHAGSFNSTNFASFVSRDGYTNSDQVLLQERVAVANTIGYAVDYTDILTIVAAGNY